MKLKKISPQSESGSHDQNKTPRVIVERRLKKACTTCWLSFDNSIRLLHQDYQGVLLTLNELAETDPKASGLLAEFRTPKFLAVVYILRQMLPVLSKTLQAGSVHYGQLQPAIDRTFTQLQSLAESKEPIESLKDLAPETGRLKLVATVVDSDHPQPTEDDAAEGVTGDDDGLRSQILKATGNGIVLTDQVEGQLRRKIDTYVDCLTKNIENCFTEGLQILNAFSVFDPRWMPAKGTLEFSTYGEQKIELLGQHFFSDEPVKCEQLLDEWKLFKHQVSRWKSDVHDVRTATTVWCLKRLLSVKSSNMKSSATKQR